jgi:uncharacterized membrane protein YadS
MSTASEEIVREYPKTHGVGLFKHEDYWAIWLAFALLIIGMLLFLPNPPANYKEIIAASQATVAAEEDRAPYRTLAWHDATDRMKGLQARRVDGLGKTLGTYLERPKRWKDSPMQAFYLSAEAAAAKSEAARPKHEQAVAALAAARAAAEQADAAAATANYQIASLNQAAREAIADWRKAKDEESKAKSAANTKPYNLFPGLILLMVGTAVLFAIGAAVMGWNVLGFLIGFPVIFILATLSFFIANHTEVRALGLSDVLWAVVFGMLISNTIGTPKWVMPAVQTEYFIKTGLVLLGASILFTKILLIGIPGVFVTWVVTPIVLIVTFWFGQKILRVESKTLNIVVSADMSVSGVSAAIATAAACKAKKEELTLAISISILFTAVMIFVIPAVAKGVGMHEVLAGAWMGGTIDATGAVVAAGALISDTAMYVAATIKMIQNIMIGAIAFGVAAYWTTVVERAPGLKVSAGVVAHEIWTRFPKFIIGFLVASIAFSLLIASMGAEEGRVMVEQGVLGGWANGLRTWFFCMAFVCIGLAANFRDLAHLMKGGKPVILYLCGQGFNLVLTLFMAWLMFFVVFPWVTDRLMAS